MSRALLMALQGHHEEAAERASRILAEKYDLKISGKGSEKSRLDFITRAVQQLDDAGVASKLGLSSVTQHHLFELTKKKKQISLSDQNRTLLTHLLKDQSCSNSSLALASASSSAPSPSPSESISTTTAITEAFELWDEHSGAQKLISSYTAPLLEKRRSKQSKNPWDSVLIPQPEAPAWTRCISPRGAVAPSDGPVSSPPSISPPESAPVSKGRWDVWLAYPTIYVVPGPTKDTSSDSGGQRQSRYSIKNPARQTFPPKVKKCERSRWGDGGCLITNDLAQIELRVPAVLSGEPTLVNEFNSSKPDLHGKRAIFIFGEDVVNWPGYKSGDVSVDPRQWGKKLNFEDLYWAGWRKMQAVMLEEAGRLMPRSFFQEIIQNRPVLRPILFKWQESLLYEATKNEHLVLPYTGHSRNFAGYDYSRRGDRDEDAGKDQTSEVLSFPIQTTAANALHRIAAAMGKRLPSLALRDPPCFAYTNVYDSVIYDSKLHYLPALRDMIQESVAFVQDKEYWSWLCSRYGNRVPLVAESTVSGHPLADQFLGERGRLPSLDEFIKLTGVA